MGEVIQFPPPAQQRAGRSREVRAALYAKAQWDVSANENIDEFPSLPPEEMWAAWNSATLV